MGSVDVCTQSTFPTSLLDAPCMEHCLASNGFYLGKSPIAQCHLYGYLIVFFLSKVSMLTSVSVSGRPKDESRNIDLGANQVCGKLTQTFVPSVKMSICLNLSNQDDACPQPL